MTVACVLYGRVSTEKQRNNSSLKKQITVLQNFANLHNLKVADIVQEVYNTCNGVSPTLLKLQNTIILFDSVDRYCRNWVAGYTQTLFMLQNKNVLVFINVNLKVDYFDKSFSNSFAQFCTHLQYAQYERLQLSRRITKVIDFNYGFREQSDKNEPDEYEISIMKLIVFITEGVQVEQISSILLKISHAPYLINILFNLPCRGYEGFNTEDGSKKILYCVDSTRVTKPMLCEFLNKFCMYRDGKKFTQPLLKNIERVINTRIFDNFIYDIDTKIL